MYYEADLWVGDDVVRRYAVHAKSAAQAAQIVDDHVQGILAVDTREVRAFDLDPFVYDDVLGEVNDEPLASY